MVDDRERAVGAHAGETVTIVVVDDDEQVRRLVGRMLRGHGYAVLEAEHGAAAQRVLDAARAGGAAVALVVTDVEMPVMDGRDLARWLAMAHPGLPVLFLSGTPGALALRASEPQDPQVLREPRVLRKPFTATELLDAVWDALGGR